MVQSAGLTEAEARVTGDTASMADPARSTEAAAMKRLRAFMSLLFMRTFGVFVERGPCTRPAVEPQDLRLGGQM